MSSNISKWYPDSEEVPNDQTLEHLLRKWSMLRGNIDDTSVSLAVQICGILQSGKRYSELNMFLEGLPTEDIYAKNESIVRAKIAVAFERRHYSRIYFLIKGNRFKNGEDLIEIWDKAHYAEEEERTQKPLTPLSRFRIRQRYLPPESICPSRKRKKNTLPRMSTNILQEWLDVNKDDPYPSRDAKEHLSKKTNLTIEQVKTWFSNARRRMHSARSKWPRRRKAGRSKSEHRVHTYDEKPNQVVSGSGRAWVDETDDGDYLNKDQDGYVELMDHFGDTELQTNINSDDMFDHSEITRPRVPEPSCTNLSSACSEDQSETSSSTQPTLELVLPPVDSQFYRSTYLPQFRKYFTLYPLETLSKETPYLSAPSYGTSCITACHRFQHSSPDRCGYHGFSQNVHNYLDESKMPSTTTLQLQKSYEQFYSWMNIPSSVSALLNCYQPINTTGISTTDTSPYCPGTNSTAEVACRSPGQIMLLDAATALLDMSAHKIHGFSGAVD